MSVQVWVTGSVRSVQDFPSVNKAKRSAMVTQWMCDSSVRAFESFIIVNDFESRIVHEWDAETGTWYEVAMWDGARPVAQ